LQQLFSVARSVQIGPVHFLINAGKYHLLNRLIPLKFRHSLPQGDFHRFGDGKAVDAATDGWKGEGAEAVMPRQSEAVPITVCQQFRLAVPAAAPYRAYCMNHKTGRKPEAFCHLRVARIAAVQQAVQATQTASQKNNLDAAAKRFLDQLGGTLVYSIDRKIYVWKPDGSLNVITPLNDSNNGIYTSGSYKYDYFSITIAPDGLGFYFLGGIGTGTPGVYYSNLDGTELELLALTDSYPYKNDILVAPDNSAIAITLPNANPLESRFSIKLPNKDVFLPNIELGNGILGADKSFGLAWAPDSKSLYELISNQMVNDKMLIVRSFLDSIKLMDNLYFWDPNRPVILESPLQNFLDQLNIKSTYGSGLFPFTGFLSPNGRDLMFKNLKLLDITSGTLIQLKTPSCNWLKWDINGSKVYLLDPNSQTIYLYDIATGSRNDIYHLDVPTVWDCSDGRMDWLPQ